MQCIYIFRGLRNEQIRISFDKFLLKASDGVSNTECPEDKVIIYEITYDRDTGNETLTNIGVYCKAIIPGPILSPRGINNMMVEFQSDFEGVAGGFQGKYEFLELTDPTCGGNLTSDEHGGGVITSPNYPANYKKDTGCIWHIQLRDPQSKVLLHLQKFAMEGSPSAGCSAAVLRIYKGGGSQPEELCGTDLKPETKMIISAQNNITLKFTTSSSAIGNGGFFIAWAEIIPEVYLGYCSGFKCHANQYCIPRNLVCDKVTHCGEGDTSDEGISCPSTKKMNVVHVILGLILTAVLLLLIGVCVFRRRRKKSRDKKQDLEQEVHFIRGSTVDDENLFTQPNHSQDTNPKVSTV
ncbi:cubilin-like [Lingula anatina]|uniref:Cubilin-like n=1 Tax=Lingula anatina TaxID=7574 RepID=A0A1S3J3C4_LINAN|nr:cubilin-like [Lingula anatina]|eukprot:XP_013404900.1 cubilin-like [Lingula anatina]